jgi:magnesium transporter
MSQPASHLERLIGHITSIIDKQQIVANMVEKQEMPRHDLVQSLVNRQGVAELRQLINELHPADIAFVIENLPHDRRKLIWDLVDPKYHGSVLIEVSDAVREALISKMELQQLFNAAGQLDSDEIADLVGELNEILSGQLLGSLSRVERERVKSILAFPERSVGALMDLAFIDVYVDDNLDEIIELLRKEPSLPEDSRVLMVVDERGYLRGTLDMEALLVNPGNMLVSEVMNTEPVVFRTDEDADDAALAFQRYDLISAPVINAHNQLVGSLNIEAVMDYMQESSQKDLLGQVGLHEDEEDLFAPVWRAARNRWTWLALNLMIAFMATLIIAQFEHTIAAVVALAALMPITANIGGNAGNQALALVIRGLSTKQLNDKNVKRLLLKETLVGLINGTVWGAVMAMVTLILYGDISLAILMQLSMIITLVLSGFMGVFVPSALRRFGFDPVLGSSIFITGILDTLGFFVFLFLAGMIVVGL